MIQGRIVRPNWEEFKDGERKTSHDGQGAHVLWMDKPEPDTRPRNRAERRHGRH